MQRSTGSTGKGEFQPTPATLGRMLSTLRSIVWKEDFSARFPVGSTLIQQTHLRLMPSYPPFALMCSQPSCVPPTTSPESMRPVRWGSRTGGAMGGSPILQQNQATAISHQKMPHTAAKAPTRTLKEKKTCFQPRT